MNILVINSGSSSLKYQLIEMNNEEVLAKGLIERIGLEGSRIKHTSKKNGEYIVEKPVEDHKKGLEIVMDILTDPDQGGLESMDEIGAIGHRVVHGGEKFSSSVLIDDEVMDAINDFVDLAPLHNPPNIMGIEACKELMPGKPMVAVFDTAFHQTIPEANYIYPLPYELYKKYGIRKYGFHGTSHKYLAQRASEILNRPLEELNLITAHLGNGASVCAIKGGKSIETSMGFTPLEGLAMGTRTGDVDPAVILYIMEKEGMTFHEVNDMLNKKSGVLGVSGLSSDFRDLEEAAENGNSRAKLAIDLFSNRVKKYIGAYQALLCHVDALVFSAGIGENSIKAREQICVGLECININIDKELNKVKGKEAKLNSDSNSTTILVIPTNEELMIAKDTLEIVEKLA